MRPVLTLLLGSAVLAACANPTISVTPDPSILEPANTGIPATETPIASPTASPTVTMVPTETPIPTQVPGLEKTSWKDSGYPDLEGAPLAEWCGIPVMTTAMAGEPLEDLIYVYKIDSPPMEVYRYYMTKMPELGWELYQIGSNAVDAVPPENANLDEFHGTSFYQRGSFNEQGAITLLSDTDSGLIYVMILCGV